MLRTARAVALLVFLVLALSACEMAVRIGATVAPDGTGRLGLTIRLDDELVDGLREAEAASAGQQTVGLASLDALTARLTRRGWGTARSAPNGGLVVQASKPFADRDAFRASVVELRRAIEEELRLGSLGLDLDYAVSPSTFRTTAQLRGTIDLGDDEGLPPQLEALRDVIADLVDVEVRAEMPGETVVESGQGTADGDVAVWRPRLGERLSFAARSSSLKAGAVLGVLFPLLGLIAAGSWFVGLRRRARSVATSVADLAASASSDSAETAAPAVALADYAELDRIVSLGEESVLDLGAPEDGAAPIDLTEEPTYPAEGR